MKQALIKTDNELILQRRRKKKLKKIFMLFILLLSLFIILCLKLPYFNIKNVEIDGNKNISDRDIVTLSNLSVGNNIFYINIKDSINNILSNPYISEVHIKRKLPSTIQISVKEREAVFYNKYENKYYVIDKNGIVLQKRDDLKAMKLVKLDGFDYSKCKIGQPIIDNDKRKMDAVNALGDILKNSKAVADMTSIDVGNSIDIKVYFGDIYVKIGNASEIDKKINKAVNILKRNELKGAKGYIDVSFEGNPVLFIQK